MLIKGSQEMNGPEQKIVNKDSLMNDDHPKFLNKLWKIQ